MTDFFSLQRAKFDLLNNQNVLSKDLAGGFALRVSTHISQMSPCSSKSTARHDGPKKAKQNQEHNDALYKTIPNLEPSKCPSHSNSGTITEKGLKQ